MTSTQQACSNTYPRGLDPEKDDKQRVRERAKWVAAAIRDGLEIQTVDTEVVRVQMGGCEKCDPRHVPKQERLAL